MKKLYLTLIASLCFITASYAQNKCAVNPQCMQQMQKERAQYIATALQLNENETKEVDKAMRELDALRIQLHRKRMVLEKQLNDKKTITKEDAEKLINLRAENAIIIANKKRDIQMELLKHLPPHKVLQIEKEKIKFIYKVRNNGSFK